MKAFEVNVAVAVAALELVAAFIVRRYSLAMRLAEVFLATAPFLDPLLLFAMSLVMMVCLIDGARASVSVVFVVDIVMIANKDFVPVLTSVKSEGGVAAVERVMCLQLHWLLLVKRALRWLRSV